MKVLVTGCNGFVGRHAIAALRQAGHETIGSDIASPPGSGSSCLTLDVCDLKALKQTLEAERPEAILHLGGIAFVPLGWTEPQLLFSVNTIGTLNLLDAVRQQTPTARVLVVTSAEVYGSHPGPGPLTEEAPYRPDNIYGVAKAAADHAALLYASHHHLDVQIARPSNHIGAGQSKDFVSSSFAAQLADIAAGAPALMRVGNLDQCRDFTDVRDVARAYTLLLEKGQAGSAYNIASGRMTPIRDILDTLCEIAQVHPKTEVDTALFRPASSRPSYDTARICRDIHWQPEIPLRESLQTVYDDIVSRRASGV